jgi:hypothetical protein
MWIGEYFGSPRAGLDSVVDSLRFAQHAIEMFRPSVPDGPQDTASAGFPIMLGDALARRPGLRVGIPVHEELPEAEQRKSNLPPCFQSGNLR